eukprot:1088689-Rhodomonas_salina.1
MQEADHLMQSGRIPVQNSTLSVQIRPKSHARNHLFGTVSTRNSSLVLVGFRYAIPSTDIAHLLALIPYPSTALGCAATAVQRLVLSHTTMLLLGDTRTAARHAATA